MSRTHRPDYIGMHILSVPQRPYGTCPMCQKLKPMHWISKTSFLCYTCLKKTGAKPYYPKLAKESKLPPPRQRNRKNRRLWRAARYPRIIAICQEAGQECQPAAILYRYIAGHAGQGTGIVPIKGV